MRRKVLTSEQKQEFLQIQAGKSRLEICEYFFNKYGLNLTVTQVAHYRSYFGVVGGVDTKFKKGNKPPHTGKHITLNTGKTWFKKGGDSRSNNVPLPLGTERVQRGRVYVKSEQPDVWIPKSKYVYEQHYGILPKGKCVLFLDGNVRNFAIENLIAVDSKAGNLMGLLKLGSENPDENKVGIAIASVKAKISDLEVNDGRR